MCRRECSRRRIFRVFALENRTSSCAERKNNAKFACAKREMTAAEGIRGAGMVESKRKIRYNKRKMGWFPMRTANRSDLMQMGSRAFADIP